MQGECFILVFYIFLFLCRGFFCIAYLTVTRIHFMLLMMTTQLPLLKTMGSIMIVKGTRLQESLLMNRSAHLLHMHQLHLSLSCQPLYTFLKIREVSYCDYSGNWSSDKTKKFLYFLLNMCTQISLIKRVYRNNDHTVTCCFFVPIYFLFVTITGYIFAASHLLGLW